MFFMSLAYVLLLSLTFPCMYSSSVSVSLLGHVYVLCYTKNNYLQFSEHFHLLFI